MMEFARFDSSYGDKVNNWDFNSGATKARS